MIDENNEVSEEELQDDEELDELDEEDSDEEDEPEQEEDPLSKAPSKMATKSVAVKNGKAAPKEKSKPKAKSKPAPATKTPTVKKAEPVQVKPSEDSDLSDEQIGPAIDAIKMVGSSIRIKILSTINGQTSVAELARIFDTTQPAISHHLAIMRYSGIVKGVRDGKSIFYARTALGSMLLKFVMQFVPSISRVIQ